jgi:hypothetical protein
MPFIGVSEVQRGYTDNRARAVYSETDNNKMTPKLRVSSARFSERDLRAWKNGNYSLVKDCSRPLKRILRMKARTRPGRRFFGEAYIAATEDHQEGWYGSFEWLTSPKWCGTQRLEDPYQVKFRDALQRHFPDLKEFQQVAAVSTRTLGGRKPVGPDLWLITPDEHKFIEVKLPGDRIAPHQLLGLALIGTFLRADRPISLEIVNLYCRAKPAESGHFVEDFREVRTQLKRIRA